MFMINCNRKCRRENLVPSYYTCYNSLTIKTRLMYIYLYTYTTHFFCTEDEHIVQKASNVCALQPITTITIKLLLIYIYIYL